MLEWPSRSCTLLGAARIVPPKFRSSPTPVVAKGVDHSCGKLTTLRFGDTSTAGEGAIKDERGKTVGERPSGKSQILPRLFWRPYKTLVDHLNQDAEGGISIP
jgi:hypothetical protein